MSPHFDGANESKPPQRSKIRNRFISLFSSTHKSASNPSSEELNAAEEPDDVSPLRVLSPRSTEFDPPMPRCKRRSFSFGKRRSQSLNSALRVRHVGSMSAGNKEDAARKDIKGGSGVADGGVHGAVTDVPTTNTAEEYTAKKRLIAKDMPVQGFPAVPTRQAALTSHSVVRGENSSETKFETPLEERGKDGYVHMQ